jgi:hypothetical protein
LDESDVVGVKLSGVSHHQAPSVSVGHVSGEKGVGPDSWVSVAIGANGMSLLCLSQVLYRRVLKQVDVKMAA